MKLKGTHKQVEKCIDLKLDIRYLIQRLIDLESKKIIDSNDKHRLKVLVKKLVTHIGLKLPVKKTDLSLFEHF